MYKSIKNQAVNSEVKGNYLILTAPVQLKDLTPTAALERLAPHYENLALCEFKPRQETQFAFIGFDSLLNICAYGNEITLKEKNTLSCLSANPLDLLQEYESRYLASNVDMMTRFLGSAIGYLSYDAIRYIEAIPDQHNNINQLPDCDFHFYQSGVMFDFKKNEVVIAVLTQQTDEENGKIKLNHIIDMLTHKPPSTHQHATTNSNHSFQADLSDEEYMTLVKKSKVFIRRGEVFQIVPSRTFSKPYNQNGISIYKALKKTNPSPYHFYIKSNHHIIVGASPEKMACVYNNKIEIVPLAGTRPRNINQLEEKNLADELLNDPKEMAEHMMLVDLARNDIGAIAAPGSVKVDRLAYVNKYEHVMHIASDVSGQLNKNKNRMDVIRATFPPGTLTGAPKIRAMELIDEIESSRRGIYGGAIIMMDQLGNLESAIAIRTGIISNQKLTVRAGAGIVHDSDPQTEANETRAKAKGFFKAVELSEQGATS